MIGYILEASSDMLTNYELETLKHEGFQIDGELIGRLITGNKAKNQIRRREKKGV